MTEIVAALIAGAATGLIALHHFGRFAQFGVVANLIAVPVTALWIMPWGVVALILYPFGLEFIALQAMAQGIEVVLAVSRTVAAWPGAVTLLPTMPIAGLLLVAFGGLWLCLWRHRLRYLGLVAISASIVAVPLNRGPDIILSGDARLMAARLSDGRLSLSDKRRDLDRPATARECGVVRRLQVEVHPSQGSVTRRSPRSAEVAGETRHARSRRSRWPGRNSEAGRRHAP